MAEENTTTVADTKPDTLGAKLPDTKPVEKPELNPSEIPSEIVQRTPHFQGAIGSYKAQNETLRQRAETAEQALAAAKAAAPAPQVVDPFAELDDDDPITVAQFKEAQKLRDEAMEAKHVAEKKADAATARSESLQDSEQRCMTKYAKGKVAAGLEADVVFARGAAWLKANKPALFNGLMAERDAAEEIYQAAVALCPEFKNISAATERKSLLEQLNTNSARIPGSAMGAGGLTEEGTSSLQSVLSATPEELGKIVDESIQFDAPAEQNE